jgi:glycosyltransferase involved in cell wall biosynthesis
MKVAIDVSPLQTGHKVRGVGFYLENLKSSLVKYFPENEYVFFITGEKIPSDIDLVHFPYFEPFFLALPLYKKYKTVVTVHDLTPIVFPDNFPPGLKGKLKWQMQRFSLKKTKRIITDSINSKNDILKYVGISPNMIDVIYLAAGEQFKRLESENWKQEIIKKYDLPEKFALYVGDVTWNKNLPRLIGAIKTTDIPLVMIGKSLTNKDYDRNNPWNHDLNRIHELTKDDKNIIKLGFVESEDLVSIYNLATVFTMPSLYEGFGLPILEAQACGCPVVATQEGSLKEVTGESVEIVDGYNLENIALGIKKVFNSRQVQEDLRKKGFNNVKKYSWKKTAEKTIETYKRAIG